MTNATDQSSCCAWQELVESLAPQSSDPHALSSFEKLKDDLSQFIHQRGLNPEKLSLSDLRDVVAAYARTVFSENIR